MIHDQWIPRYWTPYLNQIQKLPYQRAFLNLDLHNEAEGRPPDILDFEGSCLQSPIHNWMKSNDIISFYLLLNRERIEEWSSSSKATHYQELIHFSISSDVLEGCVWKAKGRSSALHNIADIVHTIKTVANSPRQPSLGQPGGLLSSPLEIIAKQQQSPILNSHQILPLDVLHIPKSWGSEGWYTGVEKRGVVTISDQYGKAELPYALSLFRRCYLDKHPENLILLKTLNPVAEEVLGDLYLEMHEEKWEVYLITEISEKAWPTGVGIIKAGLNPAKKESYQSQYRGDWKQHYLKDFEQQILLYEKVRREIDHFLDELQKPKGLDPTGRPSAEMTKELLELVPQEQKKREQNLREAVYEFVGDCEVKIGDVVTFATHQMHSLRHGIQVIEFQTPHYERLIMMFAQKVLTQDHWDTKKALAVMETEAYEKPKLQEIEKTKAYSVERFVDFPDFKADRITIQPNEEYSDNTAAEGRPTEGRPTEGRPTEGRPGEYHLLIGVIGEGNISSQYSNEFILKPQEGVFVPVSLQKYKVKNLSDEPIVYLKAVPKL